MTGFVYAYRYGDGDHVKIGRTKNLDKRRNALQVAHHHALVLVDSIEHDDYVEAERYIHTLLASRRVQDGEAGSREHFLVGPAPLAEAFEETRRHLDFELRRKRELPKYEALEAGNDILPMSEEILEVKSRSRDARAKLARLQADMARLDHEANQVYQEVYRRQWPERERLDRLIHQVSVEIGELETTVKLAIGPAAGIEGVATWKSVRDRNRKFDSEWLKADDPELFDAYRTAFDAPRFRKEQPAAHEAHMRVTTHREFQWLEEVDLGTDKSVSEGDQPERHPGRRRLFRTARAAARTKDNPLL